MFLNILPSCISPHVVAFTACMRGSVLRTVSLPVSLSATISLLSIHRITTSFLANHLHFPFSPHIITISSHPLFIHTSSRSFVSLFILHCSSPSSTPPSSQLSSHHHQGRHFVLTRHDPFPILYLQ